MSAIQSSIRRLALASAVFVSSARGQTILFADGFESGLSNWTATGFWNHETETDPCGSQKAPFPEGSACAYYGIDSACSYDTGAAPSSGTLTLVTPVLLPSAGPHARLRCWSAHETEFCDPSAGYFDKFDIDVSVNGGASWTVVSTRCYGKHGPPEDWEPRGADLTPYLGQSILVRFRFDTVDEMFNDFLGAFIDRVEIRQEVGTTFCTSTCPCHGPFNNVGILGYGQVSGCTNSARKEGELAGRGMPSVATDDVVLTTSQLMPVTLAVLLQSSSSGAGVFRGDGRVCLTGTATRIAAYVTSGGEISFPQPSDPPLSVAGQVRPAGGTRYYQVAYRDTGAYCTSSELNFTNGYAIVWAP